MAESTPSQEPTLNELRLLKLAYLEQGAAVFTDLALVTRRIGLPCNAPFYFDLSYRFQRSTSSTLYEVDQISAIWRESKLISSFFCEELIVTIGKPTLLVSGIRQPKDILANVDQALFREDLVCSLKRENVIMGEHRSTGPVETGHRDAKFIPGKWVAKILNQLDYAKELTGSMHELNIERQRMDLIYDLMIGRNI